MKSVNLIEAEPDRPAEVEVVPLRSGRRLRRVKATLGELERLAPEARRRLPAGRGFRRPSPGLADKVREILPNAVDVVIAGRAREAEEPQPERNLARSPRELFAEYLKERGDDDVRVRALFDELLDQVHAPD